VKLKNFTDNKYILKNNRIAIIGTRGIPAGYGGFETFAEELARRLVERGLEVLVVGDVNLNYESNIFLGISIAKTKYSKPKNPLGFYRESLNAAKTFNSDFILVCGVGGSLLIPFYSSARRTIAVNPDGLGFKRDKYNRLKKALFYSQYLLASLMSPHLVCDSIGIKEYYKKYFFRKNRIHVIEYGTYINPFLESVSILEYFTKYHIKFSPQEYHLVVARLEPENNVKMIVDGYKMSNAIYPLVIVGSLNTPHSKVLIQNTSSKIHWIGGIYEREKLQLLRVGCRSYWHGHSVGGTNPSLLEAMGSANLCACHDNVFNREVIGTNGLFFDNDKSVAALFNLIEIDNFAELKKGVLKRTMEHYSWERITDLYVKLVKESSKSAIE
jgi:glycosyltransferase involved in cell wall biosynthesis